MDPIAVVQDVLLRAGTAWVLWGLAGLMVIVLAVTIERLMLFRTREGNLAELAAALDRHLAAGDREAALAHLAQSRSSAAAIAAAGIRLAGRGSESAHRAMDSAVAMERSVLEKRIALLGTIGNNAPFVGLFGTVIGVIEAFQHLGTGAVAPAAAQAASQAVMASIAEALVTTAVGLLVAIPTVAANNYLQRRVSGLLASSEVLSNLVLAYLPAHGHGDAPRSEG